ncbi:MAG: helix-turn-helix domain-containing protein [Cyclobacteriaceae bacterium]|nr:helix-turn-helix domain-containing protein [Cyclobacteriaceae bacterium]
MSEVNLIIAKPEELKALIFQWLDEYKQRELNNESTLLKSKPLSRAELANYYGVTKSTVNAWVKKGLPSHEIHGRQYFVKEEVLDAMTTMNRRTKGYWTQPNQ